MKKIFFILWILIISLIYLHTTDAFDQDLGRHLKLGEIIWQTKEVPKTNLFSYTNPNEPVFNSHWGSQVIFYGVYNAFGVNGLILLSMIVNASAFGILFFFASRRVGLLISSLLFLPIVFLLLDRIWIRPEMFGNLFYAVVLVSLFSKRVRKYLKWFFPVLAFLWINLHITAVFGVFAMGVVLIQDLLEELHAAKYKIQNTKYIFQNVLIVVFMFLALLFNPYGFEGVRSAFTVLNKYGYTIVENQSWLFLRDYGFPLVGHIAIGVGLLLFSYLFTITRLRRPMLGEAILLVVVTVLTFRFVRNEILFAYTVFLTAAFNLGKLVRVGKIGRLGVLGVLGAMVVSVITIVSSHTANGLPAGFGNRESYKVGVDYFLANKLEGPIYNNFDIGGYLIYRLYPGERVFVDNRPEAYPVAFFDNIYKSMQITQSQFDTYAKEYGIKTIVWGIHDITPWSQDFLARITKDPNWKTVYLDDAMIILVKK